MKKDDRKISWCPICEKWGLTEDMVTVKEHQHMKLADPNKENMHIVHSKCLDALEKDKNA